MLTAIGCLLFGFSDSIGARLQAYGFPAQFVLMMPYIVTVAVLAVSMALKMGAAKEERVFPYGKAGIKGTGKNLFTEKQEEQTHGTREDYPGL